MATLVLARSGGSTGQLTGNLKGLLGKKIHDDLSLIRRLKTFRPKKALGNLDRSHIWPLLKNDVRLRRQRKNEESALAHWSKDPASAQMNLATIFSAIKIRRLRLVIQSMNQLQEMCS